MAGEKVKVSIEVPNSAGTKKQVQKKSQNKDDKSQKSNLITVSEFEDFDQNAPSSVLNSNSVVSNNADSPPDKNEKP